MPTTFAIIIFGGLAAVYAVANVSEMLIRRGAMELDRDTLDKVWRREARGASVWKTIETIAFVLLLGGLATIFRVIKLGAFWGYGTLAVGMATFCFASVLRAWISHSAYSAEAPNTKASGGARSGAVLTTLAECLLGGAVCWYVFTHVTWPASVRNLVSAPPAATSTSTSTSASTGTSTRPSMFIGESEAVALLGKDLKFLKALVRHKDVRSREQNGVTEYRRDDIVTTKDAGLPSAEDLGLEPETATNPDQKQE